MITRHIYLTVSLVMLTSAAFAADNAPEVKTAGYHLKNQSTFQVAPGVRAPFWPIGWSPSAKNQRANRDASPRPSRSRPTSFPSRASCSAPSRSRSSMAAPMAKANSSALRASASRPPARCPPRLLLHRRCPPACGCGSIGSSMARSSCKPGPRRSPSRCGGRSSRRRSWGMRICCRSATGSGGIRPRRRSGAEYEHGCD